MLPQTLPDSQSKTLILTAPTQDEQEAQWRANGDAWRGPLSIETYLLRETHLAQYGLAKNGGLTHWVLVDTAAKQRTVLSGCETLRKKALIARKGEVQAVVSHGIGSVFCPVQLRKRGYGARMMKELGKVLRTWQSNDSWVAFSVLYSDIGKEFYNTHGWRPFPSSHISLPANIHNSEHRVNGAAPLPKSRALHASDLPELCATDEQFLHEALKEHSKNGKTAVALVPDVESFEWHHARDDFLSNEVYGKTSAIRGAIVDMGRDQRAWCVWAKKYINSDPQQTKGNHLIILRLVVENQEYIDEEAHSSGGLSEEATPSWQVSAVTSLFIAAQREAAEWHVEDVELWNPSPITLKAAQLIDPTVKVIDRETESIASLMWYGPGEEGSSVEWVGNEKYGWC